MYLVNGIKIEIDDNLLSLNDPAFRQVLINRLSTDNWEQEEYTLLKDLNPNSCILELGACIGFISCYTNKLLNNKTNHVVIEANPGLIDSLDNNKQLNNCEFHIENTILTDYNGKIVNFKIDKRSLLGSSEHVPAIRTQETIQIKGSTLDSLEKKYNCQFDTLICDIEGSEYKLFTEILTEEQISKFNTICVEFHTNTNDYTLKTIILNIWKSIGFNIKEINNHVGSQKIVVATK